MPTVLGQEETARLIPSAQNLMHRTMLMMLYATGLRRAELCHLKFCDIDRKRMVIHVGQGQGGSDRDVLLPPTLLDTLREYWRWMKPKAHLLPYFMLFAFSKPFRKLLRTTTNRHSIGHYKVFTIV